MSQEPRYVGIDVSKATLDVGLRPTVQKWSVPNDEKGIGELLRQLGELSPALVVLEASGGLELALVASLGAAGLYLWLWSILGRCETLPGRQGSWLRPTLWMPRCWHFSLNGFSPHRVRFQTLTLWR